MNFIQESARPILKKLFNSEFLILNRSAQEKLSSWVCMSTMASDYLPRHEHSLVSTDSERYAFMKSATPPTNWRIWVAQCDPYSYPSQWIRFSFPARIVKNIPRGGHHKVPRPNTQTSGFAINRAYFFALSTASDELLHGWDWRSYPPARNFLSQIWPVITEEVPWGLTTMRGSQIGHIGRAIREWVATLNKLDS